MTHTARRLILFAHLEGSGRFDPTVVAFLIKVSYILVGSIHLTARVDDLVSAGSELLQLARVVVLVLNQVRVVLAEHGGRVRVRLVFHKFKF